MTGATGDPGTAQSFVSRYVGEVPTLATLGCVAYLQVWALARHLLARWSRLATLRSGGSLPKQMQTSVDSDCKQHVYQ